MISGSTSTPFAVEALQWLKTVVRTIKRGCRIRVVQAVLNPHLLGGCVSDLFCVCVWWFWGCLVFFFEVTCKFPPSLEAN